MRKYSKRNDINTVQLIFVSLKLKGKKGKKSEKKNSLYPESIAVHLHGRGELNRKYMLFTGREVRMGKNCARGLEYVRPRAVLYTKGYGLI